MADNWNKAAETQEQSEIQRLVRFAWKCVLQSFDRLFLFQSETVGEVSLGNDVKPQIDDTEEAT